MKEGVENTNETTTPLHFHFAKSMVNGYNGIRILKNAFTCQTRSTCRYIFGVLNLQRTAQSGLKKNIELQFSGKALHFLGQQTNPWIVWGFKDSYGLGPWLFAHNFLC